MLSRLGVKTTATAKLPLQVNPSHVRIICGVPSVISSAMTPRPNDVQQGVPTKRQKHQMSSMENALVALANQDGMAPVSTVVPNNVPTVSRERAPLPRDYAPKDV